MQPGARRRPYIAAAALPVADNSSSRSVRPALGIWVAGGTREARWCTDGGAIRHLGTVRRVFATGNSPPPLHRRGRPPNASRVDSRLLREFIPPSAPYSPTARQDIHIGLVHTSAQRDQYLQPPSSLGCCLGANTCKSEVSVRVSELGGSIRPYSPFTLARKSEISFHMKCNVK